MLITFEHVRSGARKDVTLISVKHNIVRVEWQMSGIYEVRRTKSGTWTSAPRTLFRDWKFTDESLKRVEVMLREDDQRREQEKIDNRYVVATRQSRKAK